MMNGNGWGGWMWGAGNMWLWWVLIVAGVIALALWLPGIFRQALPPGAPPRDSTNSVEEILRERYAHGEINREEFLEGLKDDLHHLGGPSQA